MSSPLLPALLGWPWDKPPPAPEPMACSFVAPNLSALLTALAYQLLCTIPSGVVAGIVSHALRSAEG